MKDIIISMFGEYTPVTYLVGENEVIPSGLAGVDFPYVLGIGLFALCLYSFFRILSAIIRRF